MSYCQPLAISFRQPLHPLALGSRSPISRLSWSGSATQPGLRKVETDQGIHGIGEAYSAGPDEATVATIHDFKRWLVGQDPRNIEHLWAMMYNFTRFPGGLVVNAAISGIEHALVGHRGQGCGLARLRAAGREVSATRSAYTRAPAATTRSRLARTPRQLVAEVRLHGREDVAAPARDKHCPTTR